MGELMLQGAELVLVGLFVVVERLDLPDAQVAEAVAPGNPMTVGRSLFTVVTPCCAANFWSSASGESRPPSES